MRGRRLKPAIALLTLRPGGLAVALIAALTLGMGSTGWPTPAQAQGTVRGSGETASGTREPGILNAGTGTVEFGAGACVGTCSALPSLDGSALERLPGRLIAGLKLTIAGLDRPGVPRTTVCFLAATVTNPSIRYYDEGLGRWVQIRRTFTRGDLLCFRGRLTGNLGLFGD